MNNVENNFLNLPDERQIDILFMTTQPSNRFRCRDQMDFNNKLIRQSLVKLSEIALVCQEWQRLSQDNALWKPVFDNCIFTWYNNNIDFSSANTCSEKVKLFIESLKEQRSIYTENGIFLENYVENPEEYEDILNYRYFACSRQPSLYIFNNLLSNNKMEQIAKLISFKPDIPGSHIVSKLYRSGLRNPSHALCIDLMIKQGYDLSQFFTVYTNHFKEKGKTPLDKFLIQPLLRILTIQDRITISDYLWSGCEFNIAEKENGSFLMKATKIITRYFYDKSTGKFQLGPDMIKFIKQQSAFTDQNLQRYLRKDPISEDDITNVFFELLLNADLDLDMICPEIPGKADKGTAISQLRQFAGSSRLSQPNAFTVALAKYDAEISRRALACAEYEAEKSKHVDEFIDRPIYFSWRRPEDL